MAIVYERAHPVIQPACVHGAAESPRIFNDAGGRRAGTQ